MGSRKSKMCLTGPNSVRSEVLCREVKKRSPRQSLRPFNALTEIDTRVWTGVEVDFDAEAICLPSRWMLLENPALARLEALVPWPARRVGQPAQLDQFFVEQVGANEPASVRADPIACGLHHAAHVLEVAVNVCTYELVGLLVSLRSK